MHGNGTSCLVAGRFFNQKNKTDLHFRKSKIVCGMGEWRAVCYNYSVLGDVVEILNSPLNSKILEGRNCLLLLYTSLVHTQYSTKHTTDDQ